jgi:hypothetical protein
MFTDLAIASGNVSKGYGSTDTDLRVGMAVSLSSANSDQVEKASLSNKDSYVGIVSTIDSSLLTLASKSSAVYISSGGTGKVLVSDINGAIRQGDLLTVSPLRGILMKAPTDGSQKTGAAVALTDFDGQSGQSQEIKLDDGTSKEVHIVTISGEIGTKPIDVTTTQQNSLSLVGKSITGHPVSEFRILFAAVIILVVLITEGSLIYAATTSSITAVGRNPLSKKSVYRQFSKAAVVAVAILIVGIISVYVVIWT